MEEPAPEEFLRWQKTQPLKQRTRRLSNLLDIVFAIVHRLDKDRGDKRLRARRCPTAAALRPASFPSAQFASQQSTTTARFLMQMLNSDLSRISKSLLGVLDPTIFLLPILDFDE